VKAVPDFRYRATVVDEIIRGHKSCINGLDSVLKAIKGGGFRGVLESDHHIPIVLEWVLCAGRFNDPTTFRSSLLLNRERVRGIDFQEFSQRRYYKEVGPAGWHQDIIDPSQGTRRKQSIEIGRLTGIRDFVLRVALEWNIEIEHEEGLL
jgi:hypothetical protein